MANVLKKIRSRNRLKQAGKAWPSLDCQQQAFYTTSIEQTAAVHISNAPQCQPPLLDVNPTGVVSQSAYRPPTPRLSDMPYALIIIVMSGGLLALLGVYDRGGMSLPVFLSAGVGAIAFGLGSCVAVAINSWRAVESLREWRAEMTERPRKWSWE